MACEHQSEASELRETDTTVPEEVKLQWEKQQEELKQILSLEDADIIKKLLTNRDTDKSASDEFYIGGVDLSFVKNDNINACAAIVIVRFSDLQLVYVYCKMVELTAPYIPGYLAFREHPFILELLDQLMKDKPCFYPQLLMIDGNGILHPREFGLACHLGVLRQIPSIGIAKKLFQVDGLVKDDRHHEKIKNLKKGGDTFPLQGSSGKILGMALRSCDSTKNPVYVSPGHKISVESAVKLVYRCCQHRVPEPIRWADIKSREYIRVNFITEDKAHQSEVKKHKSHQKKNGRVEHEKISKSEKKYKSNSDGDRIIEDSIGLLFVPRLQYRVNIAYVIFRFVYDSIRHIRPLVQLIIQFLNNFHLIWST